MKIVLCATSFLPRLGGLENVADIAASALVARGCDVTVLTREAGPAMPDRDYRLIREPSFGTALRACRAADVVVPLNVGLKMFPAALLSGTPIVIWHHGEFPRTRVFSKLGASMMMKSLATKVGCAANIACSRFAIDTVRSRRPKHVVPNPYDDATMFVDPSVPRDGDLLFVGRLVSDKGTAIILEAMARHAGLADARLDLVGEGPEQDILQRRALDLGIAGRVRFLGAKRGDDLRTAINAHRVLIVPSTVLEGFGIVALEGLACGAQVVVSRAGGLPEAVGPCGYVFENRDVDGAAAAIVLARSAGPPCDDATRAAHLAAHSRAAFGETLHRVLQRYQGARADTGTSTE